ncbi:MAG TPA: CPBP family intramembrane glutamic endopeptidase [Chitinophagaceae bacterium]|nr:CPBP family intramembrane glutamic endopeptidase [Chitinophagaceae bacterium]
MNKYVKPAACFIALFGLYHAAEYFIVFKNNSIAFLLLQVLFFITAWLLGKWYAHNGLRAWALPFNKKAVYNILPGVLMGLILYAVPYFFNLLTGIEKVTSAPGFAQIMSSAIPFAFGVLLSSFSEDILTRGILFAAMDEKNKGVLFIVLSSAIYLLNHIYRLTDGPAAWSYIFLLGVVLAIPLMFTRTLWFTGGMHWAGNVFFFTSHNTIQTTTAANALIAPNYVFALYMLLFIPFIWAVSRRLAHKQNINGKQYIE